MTLGLMIGTDVQTLALLLVLLIVIGAVIYWFMKKLFRRLMKAASEQKIRFVSKLASVILSPAIVFGSLAISMYASIPNQSEEERVADHYELMEGELQKDLKVGLSKTEVVRMFWEVDTTGSIMIYDLSLSDAKEKYILEIKFGSAGLESFRRK